MLKVCPYKCKESSDLNFRSTLKAIHSACIPQVYLIINIVWYFQNFGDNDILTVFWKWYACITICRQTICRGLVVTATVFNFISIEGLFHPWTVWTRILAFIQTRTSTRIPLSCVNCNESYELRELVWVLAVILSWLLAVTVWHWAEWKSKQVLDQ